MKLILRKILYKLFEFILPEIEKHGFYIIKNIVRNSVISDKARLFKPYQIINTKVGDFSYIAHNSLINNTEIGKFCAIGPNFMAGMGLHPTNGLSTSPMFYSSTNRSNGITICTETKFREHKHIIIGNDVFIGANVTILDGVKIGDGAVIGAGAVVSKDIPEYAIAVGVPIRVVKYRFSKEQISALKRIKWWDWEFKKLQDIEKYFYDIDEFINKYDK